VRWLVDNHERAKGMNLEVAVDLIGYEDLAKAFTTVTGKSARYIPVDMDTYWKSGPLAFAAEKSSGYSSSLSDPAAMTTRQNFTGFWTMWAHSGNNNGVIRRDFKLLDEIFPGRTKSAEEWFRKEDRRGRAAGLGGLWEMVNNPQFVMKSHEDGKRWAEQK
jgi:hypothetical protein